MGSGYIDWTMKLGINYTPRTTKLLGGILVSLRPSVCPSVCPSVRPSVRPSRMPCPLCHIYSSGWILLILGTNDHYHERVCRAPWPLTLTYIFKVIEPWLCNNTAKICLILSCPLCNVYSSGWILSILGTNDHYHERVCRAPWPLTLTYIFKVIEPWLCNNTAKICLILSCPLCNVYSSGWILSILGTNDHYHERVCRAPWPLNGFTPSVRLSVCPSVRPSVRPACRVRSATSTVLDGFFSYWVPMINTMRGCVAHHDLWPWPISSRSLSHDFAITLLKFVSSCRVRSVTSTVLDGFFPY